MYRAGIEGLPGLQRAGQTLTIAPCFPRVWPKLEVTVRLEGCRHEIMIGNAAGTGTGIAAAALDGALMTLVDGRAVLPTAGTGTHRADLWLGQIADRVVKVSGLADAAGAEQVQH